MNYPSTLIAALSIAVCTLSGCSGKKANNDTTEAPTAASPAETLRQRLHALADSGVVAFGHHDDTAYGLTWRAEPGRSDVKEVVGDYPAIMNWDLGLIEWGCALELDSVSFDLIRREAAAQAARGGINSFSWHPRNPVTSGDSWDTAGGDIVAQMTTDGTALNDTLRTWLNRAADFIASLKDAEGNAIPVVFRPWHEHTGNWFWWGAANTTPESFKALWRMTRKVFDDRGIDNVLWAYSPDKCASPEEYIERYPGDEYIDIMGADVYHFGGEAGIDTYRQRVAITLSAAIAEAKARGKIAAFTETGCEGLPVTDWYTRVLLPLLREHRVAYVTVWRNADNKPGHFYAPYPGHPAAEAFKAFHDDPLTVFATEMANY